MMYAYPVQFPIFGNLLHSHSHFAILGWLYNVLFIGLVFTYSAGQENARRYNILFYITQVSIIGMLFTFAWQGYAAFSIAFSTLHIFCSYVFIFFMLKDLSAIKIETLSLKFIYGALFFLFLSSLAPWGLVAVTVNGLPEPDLYRQIIYFYLHFQYNGWFVFAFIGLWLRYFEKQGAKFDEKTSKLAFNILFYSNLGAYVLSLLGFRIPGYVYAIGIFCGFAQLIGVRYLYRLLFAAEVKAFTSKGGTAQLLFRFSFFALLLKYLMQLISSVPQIGYNAFIIRDITIGYIHLVMLGVMTIGMLGWLYANDKLDLSNIFAKAGLGLLLISFVASELLLLYPAVIGWFGSSAIGNSVYYLFILSVFMMLASMLIFISRFVKPRVS
jgi:hypothetical protein